jgi:hypothetical protein
MRMMLVKILETAAPLSDDVLRIIIVELLEEPVTVCIRSRSSQLCWVRSA